MLSWSKISIRTTFFSSERGTSGHPALRRKCLCPLRRTARVGLLPSHWALRNLMASISRIGEIDIVPIREVEPISLNAARDIRDFMLRKKFARLLSFRRSFAVGAHRWSTAPSSVPPASMSRANRSAEHVASRRGPKPGTASKPS